MEDPLEVEKYGKKPLLLKLPKIFRVRKGFLPLCISRGCFNGFKEILQ